MNLMIQSYWRKRGNIIVSFHFISEDRKRNLPSAEVGPADSLLPDERA